MALRTMNPHDVRKLLEGHKDILTEAAEAEAETYRNTRCPRCFQSGHCVKRTDPPKVIPTTNGPEIVSSPFRPGMVLADGYAHCNNCETDFCPRSGIIRHVEPFMTAVSPEDLGQE